MNPSEAAPFALPIPADPRLSKAPMAYTARRVPRAVLRALDPNGRPRPGDLVLARVEGLGHHRKLHLANGRRRQLFIGDEIVVVYAHRYAPNQFEASVPRSLGPCHLVAGGGVAAQVVERHSRLWRGPTRLRPIGLVTEEPGGPPLNVASAALPPGPAPVPGRVPTLAVVGTSMDSGKTTTAAHLARGARRAGLRVGYAKVTGTGAAGDPFLLVDAGADPVLDFTDVGYASTYRLSPDAVQRVFTELVGALQQHAVDWILLEIADGLLQPETARLLQSASFRHLCDDVVLAAPDAMGAVCGVLQLRELGRRPLALTGSLDAAPLQVREATTATGVPVLGHLELGEPATIQKLRAACGAHQEGGAAG
ncbi:MAG: DUF1611 domain-containing protein [Myxococcota bacterium]